MLDVSNRSVRTRSVRIAVRGTVQGVGFRPFVYRLATGLGLAGTVRNDALGVEIVAEGDADVVDVFACRLRFDAPPLARIRELTVADTEPTGRDGFRIELTDSAGGLDVDAARDTATCDDCLRELRDPDDPRYRHPFINCTNCGPRYTISERLPYDRPNTSMAGFAMCLDCELEYHNPADRRFHAQPICCWACGPMLELRDAGGEVLRSDDPVAAVADALAAGRIAAIKGVGGFHLACDATSEDAVRRLRERKHRAEKAFAVMARDLAAARNIAVISEAEAALLAGPERPIVLLAKTPATRIACGVDPRSRFHGVMLPYTPIHHLLAERLAYLLMTSGNQVHEPICRTNDEALARLRSIADVFLLHDRDILTRNDDSVARVVAGEPVLLRRSRGYVPEPIAVGDDVTGIVACGPMLKNCAAIGRGGLAYVSQHIGDLENLETYRSLGQTVDKLVQMLGVEPTLAVCDRHPDYPSTRFAESLGLPVVRVGHHHAHVAACMVEHGLRDRVIGFAFDGTGHGNDGRTWGSEVLIADRASAERFGHLSYMQMPGGDAAVRHPGRMAIGALHATMGRDAVRAVPWMGEAEAAAVIELLERDLNVPLTCGLGRLFDAVSAILGVCTRATYEGQPAIELEAVASPDESGSYPAAVAQSSDAPLAWNDAGDSGPTGESRELVVDSAAILAAVITDRDAGTPIPAIAARFHNTIVDALLEWAGAARERTGLRDVCLSGGCFQNALLLERSVARLADAGFNVYRHRLVPPNDGCVALGQLAVAAATRE
jgi:hydrogenase maturation protein HypF